MDVIDIKRKKIYEVIENPNLTKNEKMDKIDIIISKTDEEILEEEKIKSNLKTDLEDIYSALFSKKGDNQNEDKKTK